MLDLMDILKGRFNQTNPGTYYEKLPVTIIANATATDLYEQQSGIAIDYEELDPTSWTFKNLIGNISDKKAATAAIKTKDALDYKPSEYIVLADGRLCQIVSVSRDISSSPKEALRLFSVPLDTEYIIRLIEVPNPRQIH